MEQFLEDYALLNEFSPGTELHTFFIEEICEFLDVDYNFISEMIEKALSITPTTKKTKLIKKFIINENEIYSEVSVLSFLMILERVVYLKKYKFLEEYIYDLKNFVFDDLVNLLSFKIIPSKKRKVKSEFVDSYDDILKFKKNKINPEYRNSDLTEVESENNFFYDKKIVITGKLDSFPLRNDLAKLLSSKGAHIKSSISKSIDLVILGNDYGPKKMIQIKELNILTINEDELKEYLK